MQRIQNVTGPYMEQAAIDSSGRYRLDATRLHAVKLKIINGLRCSVDNQYEATVRRATK